MANEPECPIEKLLRAAAKKRRDEAGAPLELQPATRRLLQGEVARTFTKPKRETRSFAEALGELWPRLAWGVALFAVLVVAGYMLLPVPSKGKPEALLAKNEPLTQAVPAKQPLLAPPSTDVSKTKAARFTETAPPTQAKPARQPAAEPQSLAKDSLAAPTDREVKEKLAVAAAPQLADRKKTAEGNIAASGGSLAAAPAGFAGQPTPSASMPTAPAALPPAPVTASAASVVAADESAKLTGDKADQPFSAYKSLPAVASANRAKSSTSPTDGLLEFAAVPREEATSVGASQRFARAALGLQAKSSLADKATPAHPVLASFQVEQVGPELRIVDGDGSVYSGYVEIAEAARRLRSAKAEESAATRAPRAGEGALEPLPAASLDADQPAQQKYFFRVVGTNRSLQKKVVFSGNLLAASNSPSFRVFTNFLGLVGGFGGHPTGSLQTNLLPLLNSRISGRVVVGNGKAVEINAFPMSP